MLHTCTINCESYGLFEMMICDHTDHVSTSGTADEGISESTEGRG